jgi:hypothetical protein
MPLRASIRATTSLVEAHEKLAPLIGTPVAPTARAV